MVDDVATGAVCAGFLCPVFRDVGRYGTRVYVVMIRVYRVVPSHSYEEGCVSSAVLDVPLFVFFGPDVIPEYVVDGPVWGCACSFFVTWFRWALGFFCYSGFEVCSFVVFSAVEEVRHVCLAGLVS